MRLKLGETKRRKEKMLKHGWKRINLNARKLGLTRVGSGTCMGHGVHGVVGTITRRKLCIFD
jgi:hypothetical protein